MLRQGTGELQLGYLQELGSFSGGDSSLTKQLQSYQLPLAVSPVAPVDCPPPPSKSRGNSKDTVNVLVAFFASSD